MERARERTVIYCTQKIASNDSIELVQEIPELGVLDHAAQGMYQRYENLKYSYDLVSGNVKEVVYQQGQPDQFYHKYEYDADNRIVSMFTSADRRTWDRVPSTAITSTGRLHVPNWVS